MGRRRDKESLLFLFFGSFEEKFAPGFFSDVGNLFDDIRPVLFGPEWGHEIVGHDLDPLPAQSLEEVLSKVRIDVIIKISKPVNDVGALFDEEIKTLMNPSKNRSATT
jgi:hypothetical protein